MRLGGLWSKITWRFTPGYFVSKSVELTLDSPKWRRRATEAYRKTTPRRVLVGASTRTTADVGEAARSLETDGFVSFGRFIEDAELEALHALAARLDCVDPWGDPDARFAPHRAPAAAHAAIYARQDLVRSDVVMSIANDPAILATAARFLGATPTISNVNMWWSFKGKTAAKEAQLFHRDRDDLKFCKLFVYLTDVDTGTGPHVYVRGSARDEQLREARRLSDEEVMHAYGPERVEQLCGPRGSAFLVDTSGIHKGRLPEAGDRLLLQIEYSLSRIGRERYDLDEKVALPAGYDAYVNRLLFRT